MNNSLNFSLSPWIATQDRVLKTICNFANI